MDGSQGMPRLTKSQEVGYWENGYLFPLDVFSTQEAQTYRDELEAFESDWLRADLPLALAQYKRVNAHAVIPLAAQIASHPAILDVVECILGPDILVWAAEFFTKEAQTKSIVSMHQDLTYWGLGATDGQLTAWVALSEASVASGCMDFVKGSHKNEILPHEDTFAENNMLSRGQEVCVDVAEQDKVHIELQPGQMSLHHGLTIHGSGPNTSSDRRIGVAIRYVTPKVTQEIADKDYAMLVRGADRVGNFVNIAAPQRPFESGALALYEEMRQEQAKALSAGMSNRAKLYATQFKGSE